jgi:hypothetical protein
MECNLCSLMKTLEKLCGSDFWKVIGKGILGKQGDEVIRKILDVGEEVKAGSLVMKEKLSD